MKIFGASQPNSALALFRWVAPYFRTQLKSLCLVLLLSMAAIALSLCQPFLTKNIIDEGIVGRDLSALLSAGSAMLAICIFSPIIGFLTRRSYIRASAGVLHSMREDLFLRILRLTPLSLSKLRQGDLMTRLEGDLSELQRFALDSVLSAINSIVLIVGTVIILGLMNPALTLLVTIVFLGNSRILVRLKPRLEKLSKETRDVGVNLSSFLMERVGAVKHIQSYCAEVRELRSLQGLHQRVKDKTLELQAVGYCTSAIPNFVISVGIVLLFVGGGWLVIEGNEITLGVLVAFTTYTQRISGPMQSLSGLFVAWQRARVSLVRIFELVNLSEPQQSSVTDEFTPVASSAHRGEIVLKDLSFQFPDSPGAIFDGVSLHIRGGEKVLMKAPSGFGKSTLIDLFHRHLLPSTGSIFVGGQDAACIDLKTLRKRMVVVSQDITIFSGTLESNVLYGCPDASREELSSATEVAGLSAFIERNAAGIGTEVGARGVFLSGGEKQRLALARAILLKPDILIVDEGTSGLDLELEHCVLRSIDTALPNSTRIIVSHRAFEEEQFDQIIDLRFLSTSSERHV